MQNEQTGEALKANERLFNVLCNDQLQHGFDHTVNALTLWLCKCEPEAREGLLVALRELDLELKSLGR